MTVVLLKYYVVELKTNGNIQFEHEQRLVRNQYPLLVKLQWDGWDFSTCFVYHIIRNSYYLHLVHCFEPKILKYPNCSFVCLLVRSTVHLFISTTRLLNVHLFICSFVYLFICSSVDLFICLSVHLFIYSSAYLCICICSSVHPFIC